MSEFLPPVIAELKLKANEFYVGMAKARDEMEKTASTGTRAFNSLSQVGKAALVGVAGGAAVVGAYSLKMADDFEKSHARLSTSIKNTGSSFYQFAKPIQDTQRQLEKFGFTNAQVQSAMATLTDATKKPAQAIKDLALVADIARGRHISLEEATSLLAKVETGHVALLGRLGIATKDASGHVITQQQAIEKLTQMYGGQAQAASETFAGKMDALRAKTADLGTAIGLKLIPVIEDLVSKTLAVVNWLERHRAIAVALGIAIGTVLVTAIAAYVASMATAAAATIAATWPILAIIAAVAAVGVGIFELATHWHQVWSDIKAWIADAFAWIQKHTLLIVALFGPVGAAVEILAHNWKTIWSGIQTVVEDVWHALKPIFGAIGRGIGDITGAIGKAVGIAEKIPGVKELLHFDQGGWVPGPPGAPQLAVVHGGEFVVSQAMQRGGGSRFSSSGSTINVNVNAGWGADGTEIGRAIRTELAKLGRRGF